MPEETDLNPVELATELTIAWLGNQNNRAAPEDVPAFLRAMHATLTKLSVGAVPPPAEEGNAQNTEEFVPAVSVRKSLASKDHLISMIDGKAYRTLRRHLSTNGLTPEEYRARYNLKPDYPMVAPSYSEARRAMAQKIGLGSKGRKAKAEAAAKPAAAITGRKPRTKTTPDA